MKKYRVYVTVKDFGWCEVEAENKEEAEEMAEGAEHDGNVHWSRHDVLDIVVGEELV